MASPGGYRCDYGSCRQVFRREKHLDMHLYKHNGERKHPCEVEHCGKRFILAEHLKRHIQTVHGFVEKQEPVPCDEPTCSKVYESKAAMKKHFRQKHQDPKTHDCPHCGEKFQKKKPLVRHLYTHTGAYPQQCQLCPAGFLNLRELWAHQKAKHGKRKAEEKVCDRCSKYFPNWSALVAHKKAAHPATFPCPEEGCGKEFYSRGRLKVHTVSHQEKTAWLLCVQENCGYRAQNRATLIGHIRRNHGDKNFKCDQCEKRFARFSYLAKHQRVMHDAENPRQRVTERRPRRDKGLPRTECAVKLAGIPLGREQNQAQFAGEGERPQIRYSSPSASSCAMEEATSATDTESEASSFRQGSYAF